MTETVLNIDDIVWACTNLCELLEFENEALMRHDSRTVRELTDNKTALARIYENAIAPWPTTRIWPKRWSPSRKKN